MKGVVVWLARIKKDISMFKDVWDLVYSNYKQLGFRTHSIMIEDSVLYTFSKKHKGKMSKKIKKRLKKEKEIGKIADEVKPLIFAGEASKVYEDTEKKYRRNVILGFMTEEAKAFFLSRLKKKLQKSVAKEIESQERLEKEEREKRKKRLMKKHGFKKKK